MSKIVVRCKSCRKLMRISRKSAKYRCPHCASSKKYNLLEILYLTLLSFFRDVILTFKAMADGVSLKIKRTRQTYSYMKQFKSNMKNNANWSNYYSEQKANRKKRSFKDFFKRY